jgi:hypothetical protein
VIDEDALRKAFAELQWRVAYLERATGLFVEEASLERPKGDPVVAFMPNGFRGPDCKGKRFSQCSPELLEALAGALQRMADAPAPGKEQYSASNRRTAARARTWARRLRRHATAVDASTAAPVDDDDFIP